MALIDTLRRVWDGAIEYIMYRPMYLNRGKLRLDRAQGEVCLAVFCQG